MHGDIYQITAAVLAMLSIGVNEVRDQPDVSLENQRYIEESLNQIVGEDVNNSLVGNVETTASSYDVDVQDIKITLETVGSPVNLSPAYDLEIYGNGKVIYRGSENVKSVQELVREFFKIDYFSLQDEYYSDGDNTDLPFVITSITIDGRSKTVTDYLGHYDTPHGL